MGGTASCRRVFNVSRGNSTASTVKPATAPDSRATRKACTGVSDVDGAPVAISLGGERVRRGQRKGGSIVQIERECGTR